MISFVGESVKNYFFYHFRPLWLISLLDDIDLILYILLISIT